jgi:hypothetical protein
MCEQIMNKEKRFVKVGKAVAGGGLLSFGWAAAFDCSLNLGRSGCRFSPSRRSRESDAEAKDLKHRRAVARLLIQLVQVAGGSRFSSPASAPLPLELFATGPLSA